MILNLKFDVFVDFFLLIRWINDKNIKSKNFNPGSVNKEHQLFISFYDIVYFAIESLNKTRGFTLELTITIVMILSIIMEKKEFWRILRRNPFGKDPVWFLFIWTNFSKIKINLKCKEKI